MKQTRNPIRRRPRFFAASILLLAAFVCCAGAVRGQTREAALAGYRYKQVVLNADAAAKGLPLVIGLHWSGSTPEEFEPYLNGLKNPVRLVFGRSAVSAPRGFFLYPTAPQSYYDLGADERMKILLAEGEKLSRFVERVTALYKPKLKPVVIGASQGGDLSYLMALRHDRLIGLALPLLATIDERLVRPARSKSSAPVNVFHGAADPIVSLETAARHVEALRRNGYRVKLWTYADVKHDIPEAMKADYVRLIDDYLGARGK